MRVPILSLVRCVAPYYTAKLREMLGDEAILIANVPAPSVADPALNGITVEFEHCKGDQSPHLVSTKQ